MTNGKRDYKKEERLYEKKHPQRDKDRVKRNQARAKMGLKVGDPRVVDHKDNNQMNNSKKNLKVTSAKSNLHKEAQRKSNQAKRK